MAGIDLVVTDLDGTLWDGGQRLHERTRAAIRTLMSRRLPLLVATGRRSRSATDALANNGLAPPAVLLDGALGRDLGDGRVFHDHGFAANDAMAVLAAFVEADLSPCIYVEQPDVDVVIDAQPSTCASHLRMIERWASREELGRAVETRPVYAFAISGLPARVLRPCAELVRGIGAACATVTRDVLHGGATLLVRPLGMSKWAGVVAYCAEQGLNADHVLAVGDGENDLELLASARVSCVPRDGCKAALGLADYVIEPAADGGWEQILDLV